MLDKTHVTLRGFLHVPVYPFEPYEPDSGPAGPGAARARPHHPPAPGEVPRDATKSGSTLAPSRTPRSGRARRPCTRIWSCSRRSAASGCRASSRSRPASRSTTSKRSPSGRTSPGCGRRSTCTSLQAWWTSPGGCARTTRSTSTKSGATTPSATTSGSRWCTAAARSAIRTRPARRAAAQRRRAGRRRPTPTARAQHQAGVAAKAAKKAGQDAEAKVARCPSSRVARDKRGYEHIYLVHTSQRRGRPGRPRDPVLVSHAARHQGRPRAVRRAGAAHPRSADIPTSAFDWEKLSDAARVSARTSSTGGNGAAPKGGQARAEAEAEPRRRPTRLTRGRKPRCRRSALACARRSGADGPSQSAPRNAEARRALPVRPSGTRQRLLTSLSERPKSLAQPRPAAERAGAGAADAGGKRPPGRDRGRTHRSISGPAAPAPGFAEERLSSGDDGDDVA